MVRLYFDNSKFNDCLIKCMNLNVLYSISWLEFETDEKGLISTRNIHIINHMLKKGLKVEKVRIC